MARNLLWREISYGEKFLLARNLLWRDLIRKMLSRNWVIIHLACRLVSGQGEVLSLRMNPDIDPDDNVFKTCQANVLWFDDGCLKGLACFMNFVGLLCLQDEFQEEDLRQAKVKELIMSMLRIPTIYKSKGVDNPLDTQIARIVKQNQDAQAQPVSSFGWACLLQKLSGLEGEIDFESALALYNQHPQVQQMGETATWPLILIRGSSNPT